jgi:Glycosyl hydrolases family 28
MGIAIGSEMSGGIQNVFIYNNTIGLCNTGAQEYGCGWGPALHVKTTVARGGYIQNVTFHRNIVWNSSMFILLEIGYQTNPNEQPPISYGPTKVQNITFSSNRALGSAKSVALHCSMYDLCHNLTIIDNFITSTASNQINPWNCQYIANDYVVAHNYPPGLEECLCNSTMTIKSTKPEIMATS